jgi:hypothetical protein
MSFDGPLCPIQTDSAVSLQESGGVQVPDIK